MYAGTELKRCPGHSREPHEAASPVGSWRERNAMWWCVHTENKHAQGWNEAGKESCGGFLGAFKKKNLKT